MTYIMQNTYTYSFEGLKLFWKNRFLRLYPMYWIVLLFGIFVILFFSEIKRHPDMNMPSNIKDWFFNLIMVFPKIIPHNFSPRLVPPSWALTNELVYYFLISFGISKNKKWTFYWVLLSVMYYCFTYLFYNIPTYRYSSIFASSLPFSLGALLYWYKDLKIIKTNFFIIIGLYGLFIFNAISLKKNFLMLGDFCNYLNLLIALLLIHQLFHLKGNNKIKQIDNYIGRYSYPLYLVHFAVLILYLKTFGVGRIENSFKLSFNALLPYALFLVLICYILVTFIDLPIDRIKEKLKSRKLK